MSARTVPTDEPKPTPEKAFQRLWLTPFLVWVGLMIGLGATVLYAFWPGAPIKPVMALTIAGLKAALIAFIYMKLSKGPPLIRLAAGGAFLWILILFSLAFADYLTRP
jgi:cytochrome c oxidase subunit 4